MAINRISGLAAACVAAAGLSLAAPASAQVKHYRFAHDQQIPSGYSVAYELFSAKLKELSKGTMLVDQFPGAQLGQEPQLLQLVKSGDIDFAIVSSANAATISPQTGVMSLHFLFRSEGHNIKALGAPGIFAAIRDLNRRDKLTVFLVEQNAFHALKLADRGYVMVNGLITLTGTGRELLQRPEVRSACLEGGAH